MKQDIEADFWKDIFVHMQHKNMFVQNEPSLNLSNCEQYFKDFQQTHPDLKIEVTKSSSYCTWETHLTPTIKLRLFIQSSIKATLLQTTPNEEVKIADAKFPYNPFPQIADLLKNKDKLLTKLETQKKDNLHQSKQYQIALQFIKSYLQNKLKNTIWTLEYAPTGIVLVINKNKETIRQNISIYNFKQEIDNILT